LPTAIDPLRMSFRLGATTKATDPLPLPVAGDVTVSQLTSGDAVQAHWPGAAMLSVLDPPLAPVP
jgi:hypothetical protein